MRLAPHGIGLLVMSTLTIGTACTQTLAVQVTPARANASGKAASPSPELTTFLAHVEESATLERLLHRVPAISDRQRDEIEGMESRSRMEIARLAEPLREVRRNVLRGWPAEPEFAERSVNAIIALQDSLHVELRRILTPVQRVQFDQNQRLNEARYREGHRRDINGWFAYIKPYTGSSTVGASVP